MKEELEQSCGEDVPCHIPAGERTGRLNLEAEVLQECMTEL
jgi:hypothetical protein